MEIPYSVNARPDTGVTNSKIAIWLFLASEIMLFGALFSSYVLLRMGSTDWPDQSAILNVPLATVNTLILITSSITIILAWSGLVTKDFAKYKKFMGFTILLGLIFLSVKGYEYYTKLSHHYLPSTNTFLAIYFTMTGLHALHIIGGLIVNSYLWGPGTKLWHKNPTHFTNRVEAAGLYWHFVDFVWIFLFPTLYLI